MVNASVNAFMLDIQLANDGVRHALKLIRPAASPLASFVETNVGYTNSFVTTWTLVELVRQMNEFLVGVTATLVGSVITISVVGSDPVLGIINYDNTGASLQSGAATHLSDVAGANGTTDWWTENASEYLLWRALVECNHLGHVFTANREANLPSPDKKADLALALLIQNDQDAENPGEIQQY